MTIFSHFSYFHMFQRSPLLSVLPSPSQFLDLSLTFDGVDLDELTQEQVC